MKRFFLLLLICAALLTACGQEPDAEQTELWVVTEKSADGGMNDQAQMLVERFQEAHPEISIRLDILPVKEESRDAYLQKIRSEVMSGAGPDVYLMPTAPLTPPAEESFSTACMEPLYRDVVQQMYNGIFTDISAYYDADDTLGKESLVTGVMDAGVMDGARYVLPLRYTYDVLLADVDALTEMGVDMTIFDGSVDEIYDLALELDDEITAHALATVPGWASLSDCIDHQTENVLLDAGETAELMTNYWAVRELENIEAHQDVVEWYGGVRVVLQAGYPGYVCDISSFIYGEDGERFFTQAEYPIMRIDLEDCIEAAATVKMSGENIAMLPVRAADGGLVAEITYYGAVGAGCEDPELAYEFLRIFLSEEIQWEQYPPRNSTRASGMVEAGYPVRVYGFAEMLYESIREKLIESDRRCEQMKYYFGRTRRRKFMDEAFTIDDSDVPALTAQVDEARFPIATEEGDLFKKYLNQAADGSDALTLAEQMIDELKWYLAQG